MALMLTGASGFHMSPLHKMANVGRTSSSPRWATEGDLASLTIPQLKEKLKAVGLKVGGNKAELVERLAGSNGGNNENLADIAAEEAAAAAKMIA